MNKIYIVEDELIIAKDLKLTLNKNGYKVCSIVDLRMVLINQQTIVNAFVALFDFFWQKAFDVDTWKDLHASK